MTLLAKQEKAFALALRRRRLMAKIARGQRLTNLHEYLTLIEYLPHMPERQLAAVDVWVMATNPLSASVIQRGISERYRELQKGPTS